jgi:hypothetical protein
VVHTPASTRGDCVVPDHSAGASALGYLYQSAWALLELLRRSPNEPDAQVSIELFDDVAWDVDGSPTERLQLKHQLNLSASITDKSTALWKTIRVWLDDATPTDPTGALLVLVTTAVAPDDTGVRCLRPATLDLTEAQRFLELSHAERQVFVSRMRLLDGSPAVQDIDAEIRKELRWTMPRGHEDAFMEMVWGWWHREALGMLRRIRGAVGVGEVLDHVSEIRDQFANDRLPTFIALSDVDPAAVEQMLGDRTFVAQLRLIDWPEQNLQRALIDYYRANVQQTRWVDDDLIGLQELVDFGTELVDEWKSEFEFMKMELAEAATDDELKAAGVALLRKLLESTEIKVRPRYDELFFARGVRHELADRMQVGWHPNYAELLVGEKVE